MRQLRLIEFKQEDNMESAESWIKIHPMIVTFVTDESLAVLDDALADDLESDNLESDDLESDDLESDDLEKTDEAFRHENEQTNHLKNKQDMQQTEIKIGGAGDVS